MNKLSLTVLIGSVSALILSACVITGPGTGTTSNTTDGTGAGDTVGPGGVDSASSGDTMGSTSTGTACDPKYTCIDAIDPTEGDPAKLCPGSDAETHYQAYDKCACEDSCATECGDSFCKRTAPSDACQKCVPDKCKTQLTDCSNE